jgi:hypothetical protein
MKQIITFLFVLSFITISNAQLRLSIESGYVTTQSNNVRVPNGDQNAGTLFSLNDDFDDGGSGVFFRGEIAYLINDRHTLEVTAAPLTVEYNDSSKESINFAQTNFTGDNINGSYQFNTYRFSYRYRIINRSKFKFDLGASLLVRDARIALSQLEDTADDTDLGYVPLVSFQLSYATADRLSLLLKGDALVGPVGRAEDVFAGLLYEVIKNKIEIKGGYRVIEGGADVDQVFNFAFFHFADLGLVITL